MADNRIAYGLAKKYGIDTKGMSPGEVWEALKDKGVTQENAQEKYSSDGMGGEHEATPAEKKRLKELGIGKQKISQLERKDSEVGRIWQIQDNTGLSFEDAQETYRAIQHYTKAGFRAIRDGRAPKEEKLIEDFIERHPKYNGKIWRGIALSKENGEKFIADLKAKLDSGQTTDMLGISSWSSAESIANEFADNRNGEYKFVFELENESGVGIDHLSEWQGEEEVLQSGKVRYKIRNIVKENSRYKIKVEEA